MLGPTTCAVEKRGSSTVNVSASRITASARSRRVTSQPSSVGSHDTGSRSRSRSSSACGSVPSSSARVADGTDRERGAPRVHARSLAAAGVDSRHGHDGDCGAEAAPRRRVDRDGRMGRGRLALRRLARRPRREGGRRRGARRGRRGRARDARAAPGAQASGDPRPRRGRSGQAGRRGRPTDHGGGRQAAEGGPRRGRARDVDVHDGGGRGAHPRRRDGADGRLPGRRGQARLHAACPDRRRRGDQPVQLPAEPRRAQDRALRSQPGVPSS